MDNFPNIYKNETDENAKESRSILKWIENNNPDKTQSTSLEATSQIFKQQIFVGDLYKTVETLAVQIGKLRERMEKFTISLSCEIHDLNDIKYSLKHPLPLIVTKADDKFYAEFIDFDIYGVGDDEKEAINVLKSALIVYYESLSGEKKKLSSHQLRKYKLLKSAIVDES